MKKGNKIGIVGTLPPPIGGVSIYLKRLIEGYKQNKILFELISFHGKTKQEKLIGIKNIIFNQSYSKIIINSSNINVILLFLFRFSKTKVIYYDHNFRLIEQLNTFQKFLFQKFLKKIDELWVVESKVIDYYKIFDIEIPKKVLVKSAFLPPQDKEYAYVFFSKHKFINSFIANHHPIIVSNASSLMIYNNVDLYGLDLQIEMVKKIKQKNKDLGLIIALSEITNIDYFNRLLQVINNNCLAENILIISLKEEIWPLFTRADLMIRPTYSDGDSISIREAIHFNIKIVASDCVARPNSVITFKNRDINDLISKCMEALISSKTM